MRSVSFIEERLASYDTEQRLLQLPFKSSGYHSRLATGTVVHHIRDSLTFAVQLLKTREPSYLSIACDIIYRILELQDTHPTSETYGIWSYVLEESVADMAPPDWNWADFCGSLLSVALTDYAGVLPSDLQTHMKASLLHAARSIFRRNVQPSYTNIAIMGAGVSAAAGTLCGESFLVEYGRDRLGNMVRHVQEIGDFAEYNSPTYTMVALEETERILHTVHDVACRKSAEWLRRHAWSVISSHYHPNLHVWAGPHSRTYADTASLETIHTIWKRISESDSPISAPQHDKSIVPMISCPDEYKDRFYELPQNPHIVAQEIADRRSGHTQALYTYFDTDSCVGSVSEDTTWVQRHGLIGYWPDNTGRIACFRARMLKDGTDFASAIQFHAQDHDCVLTAASLAEGYGDYHLHLDKPSNGEFPMSSLVFRFEIRGAVATVTHDPNGAFKLSCGARQAIIYVADSIFDGSQVPVRTGNEDGYAYVDLVCYEGDTALLDIRALKDTLLCAGVRVADSKSNTGVVPGPQFSRDSDHTNVTWVPKADSRLELTVPHKLKRREK